MIPRRSQQSRALLVALIVMVSACASLPVKEKAVKSTQTVEIALGAAQDFERATFAAGTLPWLTVERHQAISRSFSNAFATQIKLAVALKAWRSGDPKPKDVDQLAVDVGEALTVIQQATAGGKLTGPASDLVGKINKVMTEVAAVAKILRGTP